MGEPDTISAVQSSISMSEYQKYNYIIFKGDGAGKNVLKKDYYFIFRRSYVTHSIQEDTFIRRSVWV